MMMIDIRSLPSSFFGFLALQALLALACFSAMLGLRLARRGAARFWIGPPILALALLPTVAAAGIAARQFRSVLAGTALTGSGGVAALAAGSAESLLPLAVGLLTTAALAGAGTLLTAAGSSKLQEVDAQGGRALAMLTPLATLATFAAAAWLVTTIEVVNADPHDAAAIRSRCYAAAWGVGTVAVLVLGLGVVGVRRAPRGAAPLAVKLVPLSALVLAGIAAMAGVAGIHAAVNRLAQIAIAATPTPPASGDRDPTAAPALPAGGSIPKPTKLKDVRPVYPDAARQARVEGAVVLECTIGPDGRVSHVRVRQSVPQLDEAASEAVRQWLYEPTLVNGAPVSVIMTVTVRFKLP